MPKPAPLDELRPLESAIKRKRIVVYDIESKEPESQRAGFSRAFQVGFYEVDPDVECEHEKIDHQKLGLCLLCGEHDAYRSFRNATSRDAPKQAIALESVDPEERAISPGGCVDRFCRFLFGWEHRPKTIKTEYASHKVSIYAHNGGRFDTTFLLAWLRRHSKEFDTRITCVASRAQRIVVTRKKSILLEATTIRRGKNRKKRMERIRPSWTFIDSALLLPMSLAEAAKTFCAEDPEIRKLEDFDLDTDENDPRWEIYNRLDCVVLYRALTAFRDLVEALGGEIGITSPSTSMKLFRRAFQKEPIQRNRHFQSCKRSKHVCQDLDDACLHTWIRSGYHGGRVEIFRTIGPAGMRYYDLNSSYPASMKQPMPVGEAKEVSPEDFDAFVPSLERSHVGFVECEVFIPETCVVPPLPVHCEDDKLRFPVGYLRGVWSWDELKLIFHPHVGGKILRVIRSVWFAARPVFREFVDALYAYRQDAKKNPEDIGKAALSELCKLMLNSHYGKYGMNPAREELVMIKGGYDPHPGDRGSLYRDCGEPIDGDHAEGDVWRIPKRIDASYMIPQIAAQITALSRVALWKACVTAVEMGGRLCYTDSDSMLVAAPMYADQIIPHRNVDEWFSAFEQKLGTGSELGAWKREMPTWVLSAQFLLPKSYILRDEADASHRIVKLKGVGRKARTEANFDAMARGEEVSYLRVEQHRTVLKDGRHAPREVKAKKRIVSVSDKRVVLEDGTTRAVWMDMRENFHDHPGMH